MIREYIFYLIRKIDKCDPLKKDNFNPESTSKIMTAFQSSILERVAPGLTVGIHAAMVPITASRRVPKESADLFHRQRLGMGAGG